jgi:hypothetical protein
MEMIRQQENEDLVTFKDRLVGQATAVEAQGGVIPTVAEQALKFVKGLDKDRYQKFQETYSNGVMTGAAEYPETLVDAYTLASNWKAPKVPKKTANPPGVAYAAIAQEASEETKESVNFTQTKKKKKTQNSKKRNAAESESEEVVEEEKVVQQVRARKPRCDICEEDEHWTNRCDNYPGFLQAVKQMQLSGVEPPRAHAHSLRSNHDSTPLSKLILPNSKTSFLLV